jgi:hypothetical protein
MMTQDASQRIASTSATSPRLSIDSLANIFAMPCSGTSPYNADEEFDISPQRRRKQHRGADRTHNIHTCWRCALAMQGHNRSDLESGAQMLASRNSSPAECLQKLGMQDAELDDLPLAFQAELPPAQLDVNVGGSPRIDKVKDDSCCVCFAPFGDDIVLAKIECQHPICDSCARRVCMDSLQRGERPICPICRGFMHRLEREVAGQMLAKERHHHRNVILEFFEVIYVACNCSPCAIFCSGFTLICFVLIIAIHLLGRQ